MSDSFYFTRVLTTHSDEPVYVMNQCEDKVYMYNDTNKNWQHIRTELFNTLPQVYDDTKVDANDIDKIILEQKMQKHLHLQLPY